MTDLDKLAMRIFTHGVHTAAAAYNLAQAWLDAPDPSSAKHHALAEDLYVHRTDVPTKERAHELANEFLEETVRRFQQ
jgi:hypothetical protein